MADTGGGENLLSTGGRLTVLVVLLLAITVVFNRNSPTVDACEGYDNNPLDRPEKQTDGTTWHHIVLITDLDHHSRVEGKKPSWKSTLKRGILKVGPKAASVVWESTADLHTQLSMGGRGMELSDLVVFDGKLFSVDDRTGMIYRITSANQVLPWVFLNDGPGNTTKGLKGEWMTVKDCQLIVGGLGKEWTTTEGVFVNHHPMFVKQVSREGAIQHISWVDPFIKVRQSAGVVDPGYMIHESVQWSTVHKKWFFLPRRVSHNEIYTEETDEFKGSNLLLIASEDFSNVESKTIGEKGDGSRGFSAFQFVPGSADELILAIKSEERQATPTGSYITVFEWKTGRVLLAEERIGDEAVKFEGIAFASGDF